MDGPSAYRAVHGWFRSIGHRPGGLLTGSVVVSFYMASNCLQCHPPHRLPSGFDPPCPLLLRIHIIPTSLRRNKRDIHVCFRSAGGHHIHVLALMMRTHHQMWRRVFIPFPHDSHVSRTRPDDDTYSDRTYTWGRLRNGVIVSTPRAG